MFSELITRDTGKTYGGRSVVELVEPLVYDLMSFHVSVPAGFETDYASVPRLLWIIFPPSGTHNKAAVIHDYLYKSKACSRFLADALFREAMREVGVHAARAWFMWLAVRTCGPRFKMERIG